MKNLDLKTRIRTTDFAKAESIKFIESFDFSEYSDLKTIVSKNFNLIFKSNSHTFHNQAYFQLSSKLGFVICSYASDEVNDYEDINYNTKSWDDVKQVFDYTCTYVNFKQLVDAFEDFIIKINNEVENKETQISEFLEFCKSWEQTQITK